MPEFIKSMQDDPEYKGCVAEAVVAVGQIVKIEPRYYETAPDGRRCLTRVETYGEAELMRGVQRQYVVYDSLGNRYSSATASEEGRQAIEDIWMNAK